MLALPAALMLTVARAEQCALLTLELPAVLLVAVAQAEQGAWWSLVPLLKPTEVISAELAGQLVLARSWLVVAVRTCSRGQRRRCYVHWHAAVLSTANGTSCCTHSTVLNTDCVICFGYTLSITILWVLDWGGCHRHG